MVVLDIIKLYAQIDILKQIKKKHGQDVLKVVRKYERLLVKFMKLETDIKFFRICKRDYLVPTLTNLKLATRKGNKKMIVLAIILITIPW